VPYQETQPKLIPKPVHEEQSYTIHSSGMVFDAAAGTAIEEDVYIDGIPMEDSVVI
jgi:hypothetical protein